MNQLFNNRPLIKTGILGFLLLPLLIAINSFSPAKEKIPEGYNSSILAFEFASNEAEIKEVLDPLTYGELKDMDKLNYVDFGFMAMYGLFLFLFMARLKEITKVEILEKAKWFAPLIVIADMLENLQLLKLTKGYKSMPDLSSTIMQLFAFTWTKWLLLAVAFAIIGASMWKMKLSKYLGYILVLPLVIGCVAFITEDRVVEDSFGTTIFISFFLIFVYCFVYKKESVQLRNA